MRVEAGHVRCAYGSAGVQRAELQRAVGTQLARFRSHAAGVVGRFWPGAFSCMTSRHFFSNQLRDR